MRQIDMPQPDSGPDSAASPSLRSQVTFVTGFLRRQYLIILSFLTLSLVAGGLYLYTTPPTYTASAMMMIDSRKSQSLQSVFTDTPADAAWIESQLGILKSESVALNVVKQLRLADEPDFTGSDPGLFSRFLVFAFKTLGWENGRWLPKPKSEEERRQAAVATFVGGLDVRRVGPSYLVRIDYQSRNADLAVKVANAVVDAYASDQLNAKYQANQRASDWLRDRLDTLREQTAVAERAVVEFKAKNNIVASGGRLMTDQQLTDINSQLGTVRAHTADVLARLNRIETVLRADQPDATGNETVSDTLSNSIITTLRSRYLELLNREADWSVKYGKDHSAVVNLRKQMQDIRNSILDELGRIAETYKSEYAIAKSRQQELEKRLAALVLKSQNENQAEVALRSLESAAQSYRKIYDDFLQRHTEAVQQQSFPMTEARLISPASAYKSHPRTSSIWMISMLAGAMLGVGFGALRELLDHVFRTSAQVQSVLETECLAMVPILSRSRSRALLPRWSQQRLIPSSVGTRYISRDAIPFRTMVDTPFSPFADAIRSMKLTVDLNSGAKHSKVVGLTSCLPDEGKSTVALGMAEFIAKSGKRVLLVDFDLRNPSLSRTLAPTATVGLLELIARPASIAETIWTDPDTAMAFLPTVIDPSSMISTDLLASEATEALLTALRARYDYVIVDHPPMAPSMTDVRATSHLIDSYILVVEWGRTRIDIVQRTLGNARGIREHIIGTVLNKVNTDAMSRYDAYASKYYYHTYGNVS